MTNKKTIWKVLLIGLMLMLILNPLWSAGDKEKAPKKTVWKIASGAEEGNPLTEFARRLERAVEEYSQGEIEVQVFPIGTLGVTTDIIEMVQTGDIDIVFSDFSWMSGFVPYSNLFAIHGLWPKTGYAEIIKWIVDKGESFKMMQSAFEDRGYHLLNYYTNGWFWWTSTKPIRTPNDLKGYVMRTQSSRLIMAGFEALGASVVATDWSEVYAALELGLIDGQSSTIIGIYNTKLFEVASHLYQPYTQIYMNMPIANLNWWNSLDDDIRNFVTQFMVDEIPSMAKWVEEKEKEAAQSILSEKPGFVIHEFSEAERAPFVDLVQKTYDDFARVGGPGADKVLEAFLRDVENAKKELGL